MTGTLLDAAVVRHAAIEALHRNDLGTMTTAAPEPVPAPVELGRRVRRDRARARRRRPRGDGAAQPARRRSGAPG